MFAYFILDLNSIWVSNGFIETMSYSFMIAIAMPHIIRFLNFDFIKKMYQQLKVKFSKY
jgi:hypothetical protein